jgi:hypothetical protein
MESTQARRLAGRAIGGVFLLALLSVPSRAQTATTPSVTRGAIGGEVLDAVTLLPIRGATVVLLPAATAVLPPVLARGSSFPSQARVVVTSEHGAYRFDDLPIGEYQLRVQRVGYKPITLDVGLRSADDARLSVGLTVVPVRLHALTVRAEARPTYGRVEGRTEAGDSSRIGAALLRQRLYLSTDVREMTHPDVMESVTLGATDLFRAFHRLPGVTTRDDDAAELWTRGGRPDLTRIYFDGQPIFSALHSFGLRSGIGTNVVGAAFLHPGVRPASIGEGGAAVLDIHSRPGGGTGAIRGIAELTSEPTVHLSPSARAAFDQRILGGRGAWMLAGGRSLSDLVYRREVGGTEMVNWPAYFADLTGRFDLDLTAGSKIEVSGLWLSDMRKDYLADRPYGKQFRWGNEAARTTLAWSFGRVHTRHTIGASRFRAGIDTFPTPPVDTLAMGLYPIIDRELALRSSVSQATLRGELEPRAHGSTAAPWSAGYELVLRRVEFDGDLRFALLRIESQRSTSVQVSPSASLWGAWQLWPRSRLRLQPGLRIDLGPAPANGGAVRLMPRLQARLALDSQTAVSAGVGRSIQHTQSVARLERSYESITFPTPVWFAADDSTPALYSDIGTIGVERWLGPSWLGAANAYYRRSSGVIVRDPTPGRLVDRSLVATGRERASGIELSVRKLAGTVTGSAAYTYANAQTTANDLTFLSSQDRRHSFDATMLARLKPSFHVSAAYTYATGAPYTQLRSSYEASQEFPAAWPPPADSLSAGWPNLLRMPSYSSLDIAMEWTFGIGAAQASAYLQIQNLLRHRNFGPYVEPYCSQCGDGFAAHQRMRPTIGIRARF